MLRHLCQGSQFLRPIGRLGSIGSSVKPVTVIHCVRYHGDGHHPEPPPDDQQQRKDAKQRENDLAMIRMMSGYIWPAGDMNTKVRVMTALGLLLGGKVNNH